MRKSKPIQGFALLEVMMSILLFSVGILGMVALQGRASQYSGNAEDRTRAALIADEAVALMWAKNTTALTSADKNAWMARVANPDISGLPDASGSISAPDADQAVTVTVAWNAVSKTAASASSSSSTASSAAASSASSVNANSIYTTRLVIPPDSGFSSSSAAP